MHEQPPIPKDEDYLFLNYIKGWGDSITLAHTFNLTIDQFVEWANSDEVRTRVDALAKATKLRTKSILAASQLEVINALLQMALSPPPDTDDPKVIAAAQETARKAASLLFRAAQKQDADQSGKTDDPQYPDDHPDPDDDPETDPGGDSNIGPDAVLNIGPDLTSPAFAGEVADSERPEGVRVNVGDSPSDTTLPSPMGANPDATARREAAQLCGWGDCNLNMPNSQSNVHPNTPIPQLLALARASGSSHGCRDAAGGTQPVEGCISQKRPGGAREMHALAKNNIRSTHQSQSPHSQTPLEISELLTFKFPSPSPPQSSAPIPSIHFAQIDNTSSM